MKSKIIIPLFSLSCLLLASGCTTQSPTPASTTKIVHVSDVKWEALNPARGDKSPQAGTLWGDRNDTVPTGFLAKFSDGFTSPPHIHNVTYRAVVIRGKIHNDDPEAAHMWMPAGSFWTQPRGEVHITAAQGNSNIALVEIDQGPYLVMHAEEAFDSGEHPVNVTPSNIVWVDPPHLTPSENGPKIAYLWGEMKAGQSNGTFLKLPVGFKGEIHSYNTFHAVVIHGAPKHLGTKDNTLDPGSYFSSESATVHPIESDSTSETILYVRTNGFYLIAAKR